MKIKEAIKDLQEMEKAGVKNIILAYWEAEDFNRDDDRTWAKDVKIVENNFDWSTSNGELDAYLDTL